MLDDNTLIGDCLHHAGALVLVRIGGDGAVTRSRFRFAGYADLLARAEELGLVMGETAGGALTIQAADPGAAADLWAPGSNLLGLPGVAIAAGAELPTTRSFDFASGRMRFDSMGIPWISPITKVEELARLTWWLLGSIDPDSKVPLLDQVGELEVLRYAVGPAPLDVSEFGGTIQYHKHRLGDMLTLDVFGAANYPNQDTPWGQYVDREFVLTDHGLTLKFTLRVPLLYPLQDLIAEGLTNAILDNTRLGEWTIDDVDLALNRKRTIVFDGVGWPAAGSDGAFASPRRERVYAKMSARAADPLGGAIWGHPKIERELCGPDGRDWQIDDELQEKDQPGVRVLAPLALGIPAENPGMWRGQWQVYINPDVLWEFATHDRLDDTDFGAWYLANRQALLANQVGSEGRARLVWLSLLREHYNALAVAVNGITACRPFHWLNFQVPLLSGSMQLLPGGSGLFGGPVRPASHYATITRGSIEEQFCQALGIPIRTDLPASLAAFMAAPDEVFQPSLEGTVTYRMVRTGRDAEGFAWADYEAQAHFGPLNLRRQVIPPDPAVKAAQALDLFHGGDPNAEFRWVSVEDVQGKAEEWGFKFLLERVQVPYVLKQFRRTGASLLFRLGESDQADTRRVTVRGVFASPLIPDGMRSAQIIPYASNPRYGPTEAGIPATMWQLTEAIPGETAEWITEGPWTGYQIDPQYTPGDVDTVYWPFFSNWGVVVQDSVAAYYPFGFGTNLVLRFDTDPRWRRQQDGVYRRDREELTPPGCYFGASILWQSWASAGLGGQSAAVLIPIPEIIHTTAAWSELGLREALGRLEHGVRVIPLELYDPPEPASQSG